AAAARAADAEEAAARHERRAEELTTQLAQARGRGEAAEVSAREAEAARRTLAERVEALAPLVEQHAQLERRLAAEAGRVEELQRERDAAAAQHERRAEELATEVA